jgi:hypothetical protein
MSPLGKRRSRSNWAIWRFVEADSPLMTVRLKCLVSRSGSWDLISPDARRGMWTSLRVPKLAVRDNATELQLVMSGLAG